MSTFLADGLGGTQGDSLCLEFGMIAVSSVWYVSSVNGTNASGHGRNREDPFATIEYAVGFATAGDTVVVLGNHVELTATPWDINKSVLIVGEGASGGNPTATWGTDASGSDEVVTISGDDVEIRGIKFVANVQSRSGSRISWEGDFGKCKGCYFECNENDQAETISIVGDQLLLQSCTWISTATSLANRPLIALATAASGLTMFRMIGCVVSGGASGWSGGNGAVYIQQGTGLQVRIEALSLLFGSDLTLTTGGTGFVSVPVATGGSQVRGV